MDIKKSAVKKYLLSFAVLSLLFYLTAGSICFWQAWIYLAVIFVPMGFVFVYLLKKDPELLEKRLQFKEKEKEQKRLRKFANIFFLLIFILPGFDFRFQWSPVPKFLVVMSDIMVFLSYLNFVWVIRENSYASRIIEVQKGQKVIDTGPYRLVRHPMYTGLLLMTFFTPLALGSYVALAPFPLFILFIVLRIFNEEKVLKQELPGYEAYCAKTKYRLLFKIW